MEQGAKSKHLETGLNEFERQAFCLPVITPITNCISPQ
jgi:hypothetical protein